MGSWTRTVMPNVLKVRQPKAEQQKRSIFRLRRGNPDEIWITSFCENHGFTQAKYLRAADQDTSIFKGDCGCEISHGGFYVTREDGTVAELKMRPQAAPLNT